MIPIPIFKYICPKCTHEEEKIVTYDKRLEQLCNECKEQTELKPSFNFNGHGLPNGFSATRSKSRTR